MIMNTQFEYLLKKKNYQNLDPKNKPPKNKSLLRGVSNSWCSSCHSEKEVCSSSHLRNKSEIIIKDI